MCNARETICDERAEAGLALVALTAANLADMGEELADYHAHFAPRFARREHRDRAAVYRRERLTADAPRKNVEALALCPLGAGVDAPRQVRALQQFIGAGAWDHAALGEGNGILILDGSDVPKRGGRSVGVAAQWCGATGKTNKCWASIFLGYASRRG